jgi:hypothetical protein
MTVDITKDRETIIAWDKQFMTLILGKNASGIISGT